MENLTEKTAVKVIIVVILTKCKDELVMIPI